MESIREVPYYLLDHTEFDDLVEEHLGLDGYECLTYEEWPTGSYHFFSVYRKGYTLKEQEKVSRVLGKEDEEMCEVRLLLLELAAMCRIPEGDYLLRVSLED